MSTATNSIKTGVARPADAPKDAPKPAVMLGAAQERRRIMLVCPGLFVVLGAAILVGMTANLKSALLQPLAPRDLFGIEERNGSIVLKAENNRCRQIAFNNDVIVTLEDLPVGVTERDELRTRPDRHRPGRRMITPRKRSEGALRAEVDRFRGDPEKA